MEPMAQAPIRKNWPIRVATDEESSEFLRLHEQLLPSPGFVRLGVSMSGAFARTHHEVVRFGGIHGAVEELPLMRYLASKIGRRGTVIYRHIGHIRAVLESYLRERNAYIAAYEDGLAAFDNRFRAAANDEERWAIIAEARAYMDAGRPPTF